MVLVKVEKLKIEFINKYKRLVHDKPKVIFSQRKSKRFRWILELR